MKIKLNNSNILNYWHYLVSLQKISAMTTVNTKISEYIAFHPDFKFSDLKKRMEGIASPILLAWHLRQRLDRKELFKVGRGQYSVNRYKSEFVPTIDDKSKKIAKKVQERFPGVTTCVYCGRDIAGLQHHMSINNAIYVEVERDATEMVFHLLQESYDNVFMSPDEKMMSSYVDLSKLPIIVKPLISRAPTQKIGGITTTTIEKLLVDINSDKDFHYLHGYESVRVMEMARSLYKVDQVKLLSYAKRRGQYDVFVQRFNEQVKL